MTHGKSLSKEVQDTLNRLISENAKGSGISLRAIANQVGVSSSTVFYYKKKLNENNGLPTTNTTGRTAGSIHRQIENLLEASNKIIDRATAEENKLAAEIERLHTKKAAIRETEEYKLAVKAIRSYQHNLSPEPENPLNPLGI